MLCYSDLNKSCKIMKKLNGIVHSVYTNSDNNLGKIETDSIEVMLDGIVDDPHRGYTRETWVGDKQPQGTVRRNERQWSAVSMEEINKITEDMELVVPLDAAVLGANICLEGIPNLSSLPKGSIIKFSGGVELIVEEYNPPCSGMSQKIAQNYTTKSNSPISDTQFSKSSKILRGIVGSIETSGEIKQGEAAEIHIYENPSWL